MIANAEGSKAADEHIAVAGIPVADQIARCLLPAAGLRELIGDPLSGRMRRHAKPQDLSPAVAHDQEPIEQPERDGRHHEQIHRGNAVRMITKKGLPSLRRRSAPPRHVLGHAGLPNIDPELEQFAMDPRRSPQRIGNAHLADQLADFRWHGGTTRPATRLPAPVRSKARAMPAHNGLRPDDGECVAGVRKQPADPAKSQFLADFAVSSAPPAPRLRWFPPTDQTVGGSWRSPRHPPRCSSIVRSSKGGASRVVLAARTAFARSALVREVARPRPCRIGRHARAVQSRGGSGSAPHATGSTFSRRRRCRPRRRACRHAWR